MSDGIMVIEAKTVQPLAETFPYSPDIPLVGWDIDGLGSMSCDKRLSQEKERLVPHRYDIAGFRGVRNAVSGAYEFSKGTVNLFTSGLGESATANGFLAGTKTTADTNAMAGGGAVRDGQVFVNTGFIVQLMEPWVVAVGATDLLSPRSFPHFLSLPGTGYAAKILQTLPDAISFVVSHGDNACKYNLGAASMWASAGGVAQVQTSGTQSIGGQFWYLATPDASGAKNNSSQLNIAASLNHAINIPSFAANPTVAEFDVIFPFRVQAVGFPVCLGNPAGGACGLGTPGRELNAIVDQRLQRMEQMIMLLAGANQGAKQLLANLEK